MHRHWTLKTVITVVALAGCDCAGASRTPETDGPPTPSTDTGDSGTDTPTPEVTPVKLRLIIEGAVLTATLDDSAAARDFVSLLPLSLTLRDYAGTEKVSDLPKRLSTVGSPPGVDPEVGDLAYYAPWGNLAIFYRDFGYSSGLVRLGRIESGIEKLQGARGEFVVRFELEKAP
ncbi:hypothetical protein HMI50_14110 [Corallococcus carmarthensis]|nr:hypothetical protein [Corallococcus carmarthensis]